MGRYRLGIDIGGTFTDFVLQNADTGELATWKHLSSPSDPSVSAVEGAEELLESQNVSFAEVVQIVHGTTIGTNIIIEGNGARTALLVTEGFGDMLMIQRQSRSNPYDIVADKHAPLVPRDLVFEVPERMRFDGSTYRELDEDRVRAIAQGLREADVESVAVCLLHSYANSAHEDRVAMILQEEVPGLLISLSSEVAPISREYERTSTTVANAYTRPAFERYLRQMVSSLEDRGFAGSFYLMQANGGVASVEVTTKFPVRALESGPAAGVTMAAAQAVYAEAGDALAFDMGGTTAKVCLIENGEARILNSFEADRTEMRPGTGLPMLIPSIDLIEIGAGGGSLARDTLGIIAVGPQSAGADPGPVSYGLGGTEPAVTDANLSLGYLNPGYFNGGRIKLDVEAANKAIQRVGESLGLDVETTAWGIHDAVTSNMYHAMRAVTVERSRDPRDLALIPSGGAAPTHACRLARQLGMKKVLLPANTAVNSAVGLLYADPRFDLVVTWIGIANDDHLAEMGELFNSLEKQATALLDATGLDGERYIVRSADMRYHGQGHVLEVILPGGDLDGEMLNSAFRDRYAELYGYANEDSEVEVTALRISARAVAPKLDLPRGEGTGRPAEPNHRRQVYFPDTDGYTECPCYRRDDLDIGATIDGPAVIEERDTSVVLPPGDRATVDAYRNLVIEIGI
ncbi:hydantoinase/oxoprolinase family protein [Mycobacterium sp. DL440]|uniref:hydantoinase/oxoprolinase family protein n=1 Tax=Mycobacterium sp. DL440 TaxID=2675523 RepID=UPI00141DB374|nr:hydantoinase/oxoprolinase family protein [Mycobacterium sp. DL440]